VHGQGVASYIIILLQWRRRSACTSQSDADSTTAQQNSLPQWRINDSLLPAAETAFQCTTVHGWGRRRRWWLQGSMFRHKHGWRAPAETIAAARGPGIARRSGRPAIWRRQSARYVRPVNTGVSVVARRPTQTSYQARRPVIARQVLPPTTTRTSFCHEHICRCRPNRYDATHSCCMITYIVQFFCL